ncbi:MAG TPA: hypothetical protein VFO07_15885 [Roseiflexaceae bacterium]|nr:hypothetical protein [Roseiflexaceae bacterium]
MNTAMRDTTTVPAGSFARIQPRRGLWSDAWRRLRRNRAALLGLAIVLLLGGIALFADRLAPYPYAEQHVDKIFQPIGTPGFPLGTDQLGRDTLSRLLYGARISLGVALLAQAIVLVLGVPIIVAVTLGIPQYILLEATLSFIGIGAPPPMPSWGAMINEGFNAIFSFPQMVVLPGAAIALPMLSFTFLGDGLRDALDPHAQS